MKKKLSLILITVLACTTLLFGCTNTNDANGNDTTGEPSSVGSALVLLETVWGSFEEGDKFAIIGGDLSAPVDGAPGAFAITDAVVVDSTLGLPEASVAQIDEAASYMHAMNANTFTCGAYHVTDAANVESVAMSIESNLAERQWMCGFPERLVIITVDDYVVSAFGANDLMEVFVAKLTASYGNANVVVDKMME